MLSRAYETFLATHDRPTLIIVDSHIGYGAPHRQDTREAHGEPLGDDEVRLAKEVLRVGSGRAVPDPGRCAGALPGTPRPSRRGQAQRVGPTGRRLSGEVSRPGRSRRLPAATHPAARLGQGPAVLSTRPEGRGRPRRIGQGAERDRAAGCPGCSGGSADLWPSTKTLLTFEGAGEFQAAGTGRRLRRTQLPLRRAGACDVRLRQRHGAGGAPALRLELPGVHRLLPRRASDRRADGSAVHLHLDARLDQPGRGWADPSADRASGVAPRHAGYDRAAAGRCQRGRRVPGG